MFKEIEANIAFCKDDLNVFEPLTIKGMQQLVPQFNGKKIFRLNCEGISKTAVNILVKALKRNQSIEAIKFYNLQLHPKTIESFKRIFTDKNFKSISLSIAILEYNINTDALNVLVKAIVDRGCAEDGRLERLYFDSFLSCDDLDVYKNFMRLLNESTTLQELAIPFRSSHTRDLAIAINNNNSLKEITLFIRDYDFLSFLFLRELLEKIKHVLKIKIFLKNSIRESEESFTTLLNIFPFVIGITGELSEELKSRLAPFCNRNKTIMDPQTDPVVKIRLLSNISRAQGNLLEVFRFNNDIWLYMTPKLVELAASKIARSRICTKQLPCELSDKVATYRNFWLTLQNKRLHENDEPAPNKRQCTDETTVGADLRVCPY